MDAFDTKILLGPDHVKAKKSELCVQNFFFPTFNPLHYRLLHVL